MTNPNVLVAPDSFKGSMRALESAEAISMGIQEVLEANVQTVSLADGGEGTGDVLKALGGELVPTTTVDIYNRPRRAYWIRYGRVALIESSQGSGFMSEPSKMTDGARTTSLGTGLLAQAAFDDPQVDQVLVALGGTGCTDGGFGFLHALGARFYDRSGTVIPPWGHLMGKVFSCTVPRLKKPLVGLCDVVNPLLGDQGCIRMFGHQKGIMPQRIAELESDLTSFARVVSRTSGADVNTPGSGAAGGIGFGVLASGGVLLQGAEVVGNWVNIDQKVKWADWIITGEGRIDAQTQYGKVVSMVSRRAVGHNRPVIALVGQRGEGAMSLCDEGLTLIYPILPGPMTLEEAIYQAPELLKEAGKQIGYLIRNMGPLYYKRY